MGTCILMHSNSTSWNPPITYNSLNNIDFAKKRWMKTAWVIFQWKFSGFCKNPVDLVQSMGTFFWYVRCQTTDRQLINVWYEIQSHCKGNKQWVWCLPIHLNPSKQNKVLQVTRTVLTHFQGAKYCGQSHHDLAIYFAARQFKWMQNGQFRRKIDAF